MVWYGMVLYGMVWCVLICEAMFDVIDMCCVLCLYGGVMCPKSVVYGMLYIMWCVILCPTVYMV